MMAWLFEIPKPHTPLTMGNQETGEMTELCIMLHAEHRFMPPPTHHYNHQNLFLTKHSIPKCGYLGLSHTLCFCIFNMSICFLLLHTYIHTCKINTYLDVFQCSIILYIYTHIIFQTIIRNNIGNPITSVHGAHFLAQS